MASEPEDYPQADQASGCKHPREVYDLIGHEKAEKQFIESVKSGRLHHAWLITGAPGTGKATLAYRMIRRLLGGISLLDDSLDIPRSDPVAQRIESLGHGDFFLLRRPYDFKIKRLKAEIPVSETRKLSEFFSHKPSEGGWRVCLVDSMDEMNRNAENAILKTLEEPPERSIIILLSHNLGQLLPTIRSRCMQLPLRAVSETEIYKWLSSQSFDVSDIMVQTAVKLSRGGPGKAMALLSNADTVLIPLMQFLDSLDRSDINFDHKLSNNLSTNTAKSERQLFWEALQDILQAQAKFAATGQWESAFKPLSLRKTASRWEKLWYKAHHMQNREQVLNMDKKSVMLDMLSSIRTY